MQAAFSLSSSSALVPRSRVPRTLRSRARGAARALANTCAMAGTFYDLSAKDIDGNDVNFADFKDKVVLVTNVASR